MPEPTAPAILRIPLSLIFHIPDLEAFEGLDSERIAAFSRDYTPPEIAKIMSALRFAVDHPTYDFVSLLPAIAHTNAQVHGFLVKIHASLVDHVPAD